MSRVKRVFHLGGARVDVDVWYRAELADAEPIPVWIW